MTEESLEKENKQIAKQYKKFITHKATKQLSDDWYKN